MFKVIIQDQELSSLSPLSDFHKTKALKKAAAFMIISTHVGYQKRISPSGKPWAANPPWYAAMKGQNTQLTGPTSKIVAGDAGKYLEFKKVNTKRMKNSLVSKCSSEKAVIKYMPSAAKRAAINQVGGKTVMQMKHKGTDKIVEYDIKVQARPHLGIAINYNRVGSKNDVEHIIDIFEEMLTLHLQ